MKQTDSATAPDGAGTSAVAAGGVEVNGAAKEAETANGSAAVAQDGCQLDRRENQDRTVQVKNQDTVGYIKSLAVSAMRALIPWHSRPVSQCKYIDGDPSISDFKLIYTDVIAGSTQAPYKFKFQDPAHIITGIACLPRDTKTPSPEALVNSGGVGSKEVEILLTPVQKGDWCCLIHINGIKENRIKQDTVPNAITE